MLDLAEVEVALKKVAHQQALAVTKKVLSPSELYLVGGLVRNAFVGIEDTDLDVATNLTPQEVLARCNQHGVKVVATGIEHGTVLLVIDGVHVEVTTYRIPSERSSHTTATSIHTDLSGRDFAINSIAFDLHSLTILDPFNGVQDLRDGIVRGIGSAKSRFEEDPLRILRAIRFGPASGRELEQATKNAATECVSLLERVSVERIKSETEKILLAEHPAEGVRGLHLIGALSYTIPELIPAIGFEQNEFHVEDVFDHTMTVLSRTPPDKILRWAAVFHDVGKPHTLTVDEDGRRHFYLHETVGEEMARARMKHLRFSHDEADAIALIVKQHMRPMDCGAPGVRRIMRDLGSEYDRWRSFKWSDISPTMPEHEFEKVAQRFDELKATEEARLAGPSYGRLAVNGNDLIALGITPGPQLGRILKELEEVVLDDPSRNTTEELLSLAKEKIK